MMIGHFAAGRLVVASHNPGKVEEISALLAPFSIEAVSAGSLGLPEPEETGESFEANAALKARAAAEASGLPALADNSGPRRAGFGGAPGIYSARWAGPAKDFRLAMERVQRELGDQDRAAFFVAVLALASPEGEVHSSAARSRAISSGRRAASGVSATTRCSCRWAIPGPSAKSSPPTSIGSATAPAPLPNSPRPVSPMAKSTKHEPLAVYIHWPFCRSKCPYCDFNSHVRDKIDEVRWTRALLADLDHQAALVPGREVGSIFFGGGTPSLMPPETVAALLDRVRGHWTVPPDVEITLEANPNSAEAGRFRAFAAAGVNRLSLGVQALDPAALRFLGRGPRPRRGDRRDRAGRRHLPALLVRPDLRPPRPKHRRLAARARRGPLARWRASVALPADHRNRHRIRRIGGAR